MIQLLDQKLVSDLENLTKPQPVEPPTTKDSTEQEQQDKQEEKEQQQQQTSEQEDIDKDVIMKDVDDIKHQQHQQQQQQQQQVMLSPEEIADETAYLQKKHKQDVEILESIFKQVTSSSSNSSSKELPENVMPKKQVPEYLQDPISFNLFVDPVITKSGQTYERSWILEHLRTHKTEPFSRQLLTEKDLVPNLAIKEAAEEFIKQEGEY